MSKYKAPTGLFDIVPDSPNDPWRTAHLWAYVESRLREHAETYGYQEIRTPIFERSKLFVRSSGEDSDVVSKEMYHFKDKGDRDMALRPEGTAPIMRAFIENSLENQGSFHKLFYLAPMFRYDRPQAGRYRQHHQFGVEVVGTRTAEQDAEVIDLLYSSLSNLGLSNMTVRLNSIGDQESRNLYRDALKSYLEPHLSSLSEDSQRRFKDNPLRILDSKNEKDIELVQNAPSMFDFLSDESYYFFERVQTLLKKVGVPFVLDPLLVRGLDYYCETVFEVVTDDLGAQNSLGGGGRFDGLLKDLGGPNLASVGFGAGIERIIQAMIKQNATIPEKKRPTLFLIPMGEKAVTRGFEIIHNIRAVGVSAQMDLTGRKLGKAMNYANDIGAKFVVVLGDNELDKCVVELKEMESGKVTEVNLEALASVLQISDKSEPFMQMWGEMDRPYKGEGDGSILIEKVQESVSETKSLTNKFQDRLEKMRSLLEDTE